MLILALMHQILRKQVVMLLHHHLTLLNLVALLLILMIQALIQLANLDIGQ